MIRDLHSLPDGLPVPVDDGACDHLPGMVLPALDLPATNGRAVNLAMLTGTTVLFCYPKTGHPDGPAMPGWNEIPGARGCTPQNCGFRDHYADLKSYADNVFGISTQPLSEQQEARQRLGLPYELLNDSTFSLIAAMNLPTFYYDDTRLIKRLALVAVDAVIEKVFYPVFPPDQNALQLLEWFRRQSEF